MNSTSSPSAFDTWLNRAVMVCALVIGGMVVQRRLAGPEQPGQAKPRKQSDWPSLAAGNLQDGSIDAPIRIVVFSDFQCPYCKVFSQSLAEIERRYPGKVRLIFRNAPIPQLHDHAVVTAIGAECAAQQGSFRAYHDTLFRYQDSIGSIPLGELARRAGIRDTATFSQCLVADKPREALLQDSLAVAELAVVSTPTVVMNGWRFSGTPTPAQLEEYIPRGLKKSKTAQR